MKQQLEAVKLFHETFKAPIANEPTLIPAERSNLRFKLMQEENEEYQVAVANNDLVEVADSLGDMLYILCGTIIEHGLQHKIEEVFDEIQRSNMSKLGEDGQPIFREDGKILKGPGYFIPNIKEVLERETKAEQTARLKKLTPEGKHIVSIAAFSENSVIGIDGKIPWEQREDMRRFKEKTLGKHIIMGRKTFESLPFLLPNRTHIVITRDKNFHPLKEEGVIIVHSLEEAIEVCPNNETSYVIGGGEIYKEAMSIVDELELTLIHTKVDWEDTQSVAKFPPAIEHMGIFKIVSRTDHKADEKNQFDYSFINLVRK